MTPAAQAWAGRARHGASAALFLALCALTLAHTVLGVPGSLEPVGAALFAYLVLELAATSRAVLGSAAVLVGLGALAGGTAPGALLVEAAVRTLPFLVLFLAVLCLQRPALTSPTLRAIGTVMARQPAGRRAAGIEVAAHVLGAALNLAGLVLVLSLRDPGLPPRDQVRLAAAAMRGFGAAALWSPLFVAMSVVLAVLPGLGWLDIAWRSGIGAAAILALAWAWNRVAGGPAQRPAVPAGGSGARLGRATLIRAWVILGSLFAPVIALFEGYGLSIPIALGLVAPAIAGLWQAVQSPAGRRAGDLAQRAAQVFAALPGLRNEALLFFAANVFGLGLAGALDPAFLSRLAGALPSPGLAIPVLINGGLLLAGLGVHPLVVVLAVGSVLSPEVLHLSDLDVALCLLAVWGLGAIMSPFSGTVLQVARLTNSSPFVVAWRWNAPFCLAAGLPVSALVYAIAALL